MNDLAGGTLNSRTGRRSLAQPALQGDHGHVGCGVPCLMSNTLQVLSVGHFPFLLRVSGAPEDMVLPTDGYGWGCGVGDFGPP